MSDLTPRQPELLSRKVFDDGQGKVRAIGNQ